MLSTRGRWPWVLPAVALGMLVLSGCGGAESRYATHMERGKQFLASGNLDKAGVEFRNALQIKPKSAEALREVGKIAETRKDLRTALKVYQQASDLAPGDIHIRTDLARVFLFAGFADNALKLVEPVLNEHPNDPDLLTIRGGARLLLKNTVGARADAEQAVKLDPANENAVSLAAAIYRDAGDYTAAIGVVGHALDKLPKSADLREILANLYQLSGQPDEADAQLRKLIELRPQELSYRYQLALAYTRTHRVDDAQKLLEDTLRTHPDSNEAKLTLVDFISAQRSPADAQKTLRAFIAKQPDNYDLQLGLGSLLERTGAVADAVKIYEGIAASADTNPKGLIARDRMAALRASQADYAGARKLIAEVLAKNPRDNDAIALRGNIELDTGEPAAAIADLRAVLRDQPNSVSIRRTLARAYTSNGELGLAEEILRAAMQVAPNDPDVRVELAELLAQSDRTEAAVGLLQEGVHAAPTDWSLRLALARVYVQARNFQAARTAAEDLKTLRPKDPTGLFMMALVDQSANKLADSQSELEQALQLQPDTVDIMTELVHVQTDRGHAADAVSVVRSAVERNPNNAKMVNLLGEALFASKDLAGAEQTFARASTLAPKWWIPYRNQAIIKVAKHDMAGAVAIYEAGVKSIPSELQLAVDLSNLYEKTGHADDAIALYERLYKDNARSMVVANNLALLLVTHKSDRASLDRARNLITPFTSSQNGELLDTSGWVRFKLGEYVAALPLLERAAERAPRSRVIRYHLGMAQLQAGQRDRARSNLELALSGGANFYGSEEARTALAGLAGGRAG